MARILVVDDEADMRLALSNVLTRTGHQVAEAPEGESALAVVEQGLLDLVLLDMRLPGMDGIQILKRIRQARPELPVIMVTGYGSVDSAIEVMRLGASHYLAKPFSNKELVETVERVLDASRVPVAAGGPAAAPSVETPPRRSAALLAPSAPPPPPLPAPRSSRSGPSWGLAFAAAALAALALLAWPLLERHRRQGREYPLVSEHPAALAWVGNRLWTADWFTQTVHEHAAEAGTLRTLRTTSLPHTHITGLAVAKETLFVSDPWRKAIQRRKLDGRLTLQGSVKSPGPNPSGLFFDGRYLWSADATQGRFYQHELDDELTVIASYRSPGKTPVGMFRDDRYFWSADADTRLIYRHRLDASLRVLATYQWPRLNEGAQPLSGFTFRDGQIWLARDGLAKAFQLPVEGFEVRHAAP
ncbi:MAG: response regulator [Elusimicrobia bacterium]|nr:response regulator [Elusimicrobiota bacterium]